MLLQPSPFVKYLLNFLLVLLLSPALELFPQRNKLLWLLLRLLVRDYEDGGHERKYESKGTISNTRGFERKRTQQHVADLDNAMM
ncbi:hypothetical protein HDV63DRAFT_372096, partial [Trichoderma sp. SZMC 28014]